MVLSSLFYFCVFTIFFTWMILVIYAFKYVYIIIDCIHYINISRHAFPNLLGQYIIQIKRASKRESQNEIKCCIYLLSCFISYKNFSWVTTNLFCALNALTDMPFSSIKWHKNGNAMDYETSEMKLSEKLNMHILTRKD